MHFRWIPVAVLWLCVIPDARAAGQDMSIEDAGQELEEINNKIQKLTKKNLGREGELGKIQLNLQKLDKLIESASVNLNKVIQQIHSTHVRLQKLDDKKAFQAKSIHQHQSRLAEQLRRLHRSSELVRIFGLAKPQSLNQYLINQSHFRYLQKTRSQKIAEIHQQQRHLQQTEQAFTTELKHFERLSRQAKRKKAKLAKEKNHREKMANKLLEGLKASKKEIASLDANRKQLNELIEKLRFVNAHPKDKDEPSSFGTLQGKLKWPVKGTITKTSSAPGVTIHTDEGLDVRAVSGGRVVFADWMRGFGLLIIIDHGKGYMSLYGNNQSLYKKSGDWAEPGAVISTTGRSGGKKEPGLYFEIRKNAKPKDPRNWCKS
ncbi:MAG: hypothetical protein DSZ28_07955 [Thiothrix sp.]|nr:MAG: hypothetical protein DSZ28_07955 [Thiothrix sp.]